jgi:hypothetical protein
MVTVTTRPVGGKGFSVYVDGVLGVDVAPNSTASNGTPIQVHPHACQQMHHHIKTRCVLISSQLCTVLC